METNYSIVVSLIVFIFSSAWIYFISAKNPENIDEHYARNTAEFHSYEIAMIQKEIMELKTELMKIKFLILEMKKS